MIDDLNGQNVFHDEDNIQLSNNISQNVSRDMSRASLTGAYKCFLFLFYLDIWILFRNQALCKM